jgi:DNA polymerase elongation subunit (family B)
VQKARILLFDIETTPNISYTWGRYEQNVIAVKTDWRILCVAYKWLGSSGVHFLTTQNKKDDKELCESLHKLLQQSDVVVAHNGDEFDVKKSKARFLVHGLKPIKHLATVDTKKVAKSAFRFDSNKLDDLGATLKLGRKKKHTGFDLWLGCMKDDPASWRLMEKYNRQDVILLERVYLKLRPWMKTHPSISALDGRKDCPKCGSSHVHSEGVRANSTTLSRQMHCISCNGWYLIPIRRVKEL